MHDVARIALKKIVVGHIRPEPVATVGLLQRPLSIANPIFPLLTLAPSAKHAVTQLFHWLQRRITTADRDVRRSSPGLSVAVYSFEHVLGWRLESWACMVRTSDFSFSHTQVDKTKNIRRVSMTFGLDLRRALDIMLLWQHPQPVVKLEERSERQSWPARTQHVAIDRGLQCGRLDTYSATGQRPAGRG